MTTLDALINQSLSPNAFPSYPSQNLAATSYPTGQFVSPVSTSPNTWAGAPAQSSWPVNNDTHGYQDAWNPYQAPNPNPITDSNMNSNLAISQPYEIPSLVPSFSVAQPQQPLSAENSLSSSSSSSSSFSSSMSSPASMNSLIYPRQPWPSYSLPAMNGPVRTNIHNPSGQMAVFGNIPSPATILPFNSGQLARMYQGPPSSSPHHPVSGSGLGGPTQDRPFKCDQCLQSFNRNHDLKRHKRIHLSVKPFPCTHCDKSFSRKDALKVCFFSFTSIDGR